MPCRLAASFFLLICFGSLAAAQDTTPAPDRISPNLISPDVIQGLLIKRVNPIYPPLARQARIQGTVILKIVITKSGDVENVQLVSGHPMLAPAAIEAVRQWKYEPYTSDGKPVDVETSVQVIFRLADTPPPAGVTGDFTPPVVPIQVTSETAGAGKRVRVSEGVMRTLRSENVDPIYPPSAIQARVQGTIVLSVQINESGEVARVDLISGHPMFAQAAIDAVKQWKYKPYLLNGEPTQVETTVRLSFTLPVDRPGKGVVADAPLLASPDGTYHDGLGGVLTVGSKAALPQRIRVSSGVATGLLIAKVNPEYPPDARAERIQGLVVLKANIDKEGNVYKLELISGHPLLAPAAIDAVKQWKYKPYLLNGTPVEVETQIQVNFVLSGG